MLDINQWVRQEYLDPNMRGHFVELEPWSEAVAIERARRDGLALTDDHLGIMRVLRDCYADNGAR